MRPLRFRYYVYSKRSSGCPSRDRNSKSGLNEYMKNLTILRHAKARPPDGFDADQARPLTQRGLRDATNVGHLITHFDTPIDWIISSPTVRTQQTALVIAEVIEYKQAIVWVEELYAATADTILKVLSEIDAEVDHVLLVGHNPGIEMLVSGLCAGATERLNVVMSPASFAHLQIEIFWWNQIRWGSGQLRSLVRPKLLRSR
jgi:phosphohistidine phosphatase